MAVGVCGEEGGGLCKRTYSVGEGLLVFVVRGGGVKDSIVMGRGCWCLW